MAIFSWVIESPNDSFLDWCASKRGWHILRHGLVIHPFYMISRSNIAGWAYLSFIRLQHYLFIQPDGRHCGYRGRIHRSSHLPVTEVLNFPFTLEFVSIIIAKPASTILRKIDWWMKLFEFHSGFPTYQAEDEYRWRPRKDMADREIRYEDRLQLARRNICYRSQGRSWRQLWI